MAPLNIYYQNCRGLRTKQSEFYANILGVSYDLVVLTETWFQDRFNSYSYFTNDYFVYRKDRPCPETLVDVRGGGSLIAIKKTYKVQRRFDLDFNGVECVWIEVKLNSDCSLLIGNHYLSCTIDTDILERYSTFLLDNIDISRYKILCLGDYKYASI